MIGCSEILSPGNDSGKFKFGCNKKKLTEKLDSFKIIGHIFSKSEGLFQIESQSRIKHETLPMFVIGILEIINTAC